MQDVFYILQIETATSVCSVALSKNGQTIAVKNLDEPNIHASKLTVLIAEVMQSVALDFGQLAAVAVSKGPGSYTGLRIGVSTAKGIAFALNIPLLSINTLQMMQNAVIRENNEWVCPMIDARRMEVFTALFDATGKEIQTTQAKIIDKHSFEEVLNQNIVYFIGNGAAKCKEVLMHPHALFLDQNVNQASQMSESVYLKFINGQFEDTAYFEPFYLKEYVPTVSKKNLLT